jgi:hypothetical protein
MPQLECKQHHTEQLICFVFVLQNGENVEKINPYNFPILLFDEPPFSQRLIIRAGSGSLLQCTNQSLSSPTQLHHLSLMFHMLPIGHNGL